MTDPREEWARSAGQTVGDHFMKEMDDVVQEWLDDLAFIPDKEAYDGPVPVTAFQPEVK